MSEGKVSSSDAFSPRSKKASAADDTLQNGDMDGAGDIRTFEFDECSGDFGVVLENKDPCSPSRARTALGNIRIADLLPDSRAKRDGMLEVGDRVMEINGRDLSKASLERARWYLGSALRSGKLKMKVLRGPAGRNITPVKNGVVPRLENNSESSGSKNRVKKIHILKDSRGLGVQILMKLNHETGEKGVFVSDVSPGGAAARDGRLKEGDELLWINGHSLIGVTQQEAVDLLRASPKLIQLVISTQVRGSTLEKKAMASRLKKSSLDNVTDRAGMQGSKSLPQAKSAESLVQKGRKMSSGHMGKKIKEADKKFEKGTTESQDKVLQQSMESSPSKIVENLNPQKDNQIEETGLQDKSHNEGNHALLNGNEQELINGRHWSSSSDGSNGQEKSDTKDVLLSKGEESLESEPVTLEDKPLSKGSSTKSLLGKLPSLSPPIIDASKKRNSPNLFLNNSPPKEKPTKSGMRLEPGQISPSLPRPQSPGGMGIAFSARYLGDPPANVMTKAMPTPRNFVGSNDRDSPQAKKKGSNETSPRRTSKTMKEEVVTIVLVKGMNGKGLGFTIVGGKGSPHGDMAVHVRNILPGGAAEADGRMRKGDEVLSVNETSFEGFTHQQALDTFKNLRRGIVTLKVRRNSPGAPSASTFTTPRNSPGRSRRNSRDVTAESTSSSNSSSPTMFRKLRQKRSQKDKISEIVLYKEPGSSLGIGLGEQHPSTQIPGIFVQCIIQGTPADNDGRLRKGDQLLEVNNKKLEGLSVENIYNILDKTPPGKVYFKVVQNNASDKLPLQLNDELTKLQSERQFLDKKMSGKSKSSGTASTLSGASESSESCDNLASLSSSCDLLIPHSVEQNKKKKSQTVQESDDDVFTHEPDSAEFLEDIYTIIKQPTGGLGMGVTVDKSRGNTIAEGVSIKSVTEGGSAALARGSRGVGLKLGDQIIAVNGTHLRGMDQEDVIKIFRDLPSSTQMKIRRSKMTLQGMDSNQRANKSNEPSDKTVPQDLTPLPKPPDSKRRSSRRGKVKPGTQEERSPSSDKTDKVPSSGRVKAKKESDTPHKEYIAEKKDHNGIKDVRSSDDQERSKENEEEEARSTKKSPFKEQIKPVADVISTSKYLTNKNSEKVKDQLGDNLIIPSGYRKVEINIKKEANSTLGLSLVPSYGNLKGYFQIRRLQSGMVCAQDRQLQTGDKLVSVNGVSLKGVTHSMALQLLKKPTELVTFVILREGEDPQERVSSPVSEWKSDLSSGQNYTLAQDSGTHGELSSSSRREEAKTLPCAEKAVSPSKSQWSRELKKLESRDEPHSRSNEDRNIEEDIPELPSSPPPPPLLDADDLLENDLSIALPSFSPPPPPVPPPVDDVLPLSPIPVVSPPPILSPRMKEFLEQDPFRADRHESNNIQDDEISPESSISLNQACFRGNKTGTGWDFQSLLDACNDLNTNENDDEFISGQTTSTEATSLSGNCKPSLPSETMKTKDTFSEKLLETSTGSPAEESGHEQQNLDLEKLSAKPKFGVDKGLLSPVKGPNTKKMTTPSIIKHKIDVDVKPVAGRRDENVPFAIIYQKKFRNLGFKVDLTEEGKVIVSDVSSFGLVGKDGNIRVGDFLLSINETPLEGMAFEDVHNMIKNCPRGDVRIVAQAGPKPPKPTELLEEKVSSQKEKGELDEIPDKMSSADRESVPDVLSSVAAYTPWVDISSELISLKTSKTFSGPVSNLPTTNHIPDPEESVTSITLSQELTDELIAAEGCEGSELEGTEFDDLPPSSPPPPLPTDDAEEEEDYSGEVPELLTEDIVENLSLNPPANFEDFVDENLESALSFDSEVEEANTVAPQPPQLFSQDAQSPPSYPVQKKEYFNGNSDIPSGSQEKQKQLTENLKQQAPMKPPRLFGDNIGNESIHKEEPLELMNNSFVQDAAALESLSWNGQDKSPIKPPSLFDDELESLPSLPRGPPPPKPRRQVISQDTVSSTSSSPLLSCWFDRESSSHLPNLESTNLMAESGLSSPSHEHTSIFGIPDAFSDAPIQLLDDLDDDMSSLPPAPPPPRSQVNMSSSWSVESDKSVPSSGGETQLTHITSPLPHSVKPERKNSKKRTLSLPIRSKRGSKTSEQSGSSGKGDELHESPAYPSQVDFVAPITSSDDNQAHSLTHDEPPEDDMESLPPAPPPPRISPLTMESLESFGDGLQAVKVKTSPGLSASEEDKAKSSSVNASQSSPKKKKKSFRRNVIEMEAEGSIPEFRGVSVKFPVVHETDHAADSSLKQDVTPREDEVAVTDSSDAMSPPPLPPEMELWSEAGAAEAELAFLDQILTLEDLSHSGSEQDSEGGSSPSSKPPSLSTEMSNLDTKSSQSKEGSTVNTSQETHGHTYSMMSTEGLGQTNVAFSSLEESSDTGSGGIPDLEPMNLSSSINSTEANPESELHYPPLDLKGRTESNATHFKPKDRLLKQPTKGEDSAENFTKQRRPAPPIPSRPPGKTSGAPRKSLPGGIPVLPSKPDVKLRATSPPQESTQKLKKEQERLSSPVKEKTSKKLFSRGHKGKDKKADPDHLQSPDTSFDANPVGRERSRSWTKKLFGFRSRSRSKNRDKPKDGENRSRSVSPPRGLFSRSRRSSPPLPPPTTKKDPLGKQKKDAGVKDPVHEDVEKPIFNETKFLSQTLPFTFKSSDLSTQMKNYVERNNNNKFGVLTTKDEDMRPEVATNEINFQQAEDGSSIEQDESCSENADLDHEEKEYEIDIEGVSLFTDDDDVTESHVYAGVDTSLANRPPSPKREKQPNTSAVITAEYEERKAVKDNLPTKSPYKPPVPKKPTFLKSVGTHSRQQQETMDELKQKISKERMKTSPLITEDLDSDTEGKAIEDSNVLPSPGPPNFKAVPPPLAVQASSSLAEKDDFSTAPHCPNSPGPPRFKPPPPPLSLKPATVQNDTTGDETSDSPVSPGPPNFKPAPPPIDLLVQNKSIDCGNEDLPRTTGAPTAKPLPPIPVLGKSKKREDVFPAEQGAAEDTYDVVAPALHNEEPRKTKPLPPVPTDLNLNTTGNAYKLTLSRQNAQEVDKNEDLNNPEIWEQNTDPSPSQILLNEYNDYPQLSQGAEPVVTQNVSHEVNAHSTDDFDSSDVSSEWEDTCSSTQEYSGQPLHGNKVARSASFSAGDVPMQRPSIIDEETKRSTPVTKRPPPFFRRRSSSLPQLLADSLTGQASEGKVGQADYWHTGNLQQLIDSRNQEEDVEEGILEVQLLKEQKSIGLMVVGGLDTHLGMLYIKNIQPNSPAANCNRLRVGDQLLQVNDNCLVGVTHSEALNILKNTPPLVKLTVARKKDNGSDNIELVAEGRRVPDAEEPIVSSARESSTISKTASDLPLSPPLDRGQRPKSLISLSSFGASFNNDSSPASPCGSFDDSDDYIPAYLEPESPTLTLRQDDVPVTIIDGIPGEYDSTTTEDEEEVKPVTKSVTWAVSSDDAKVFTVELLKNGRAGLGLSVTGGVDTPHDDIMVRQILSNSVTADNGHIKKGDILLSVNGKSFKGLTNLEALTLLKNTPERVTLVVSRPLGHRQQSKAMTLLRNKSPNKEITSDSDAWPTKEELTKKKNMANSNNTTPPTLEKIPLDVVKHNGEHSTFDRLKKRFFSNGGPIRLQKVPHGPSVTELTLEKGASGLGFSLGGGQDSLYGDAPIHVRYVFKESVAGRSGALKPGDEIIEVNGQKVAYMANVDVLELIRKLPYGPVVMKIRRK